jgi:hypothetical protein
LRGSFADEYSTHTLVIICCMAKDSFIFSSVRVWYSGRMERIKGQCTPRLM